jgi:hypothetical protein
VLSVKVRGERDEHLGRSEGVTKSVVRALGGQPQSRGELAECEMPPQHATLRMEPDASELLGIDDRTP